jgi:pimeloyl-ACP methyl ester carboxylesterase
MSEPPRERDVTALGATVHLREWGPPDGRPLVFWHGLGSYTGLYLRDVAELLGRDYGIRSIALDPPGVGASPELPPDRYGMPELAELLAALIERLETGPCVLLGHSWGALVACHLAATRPDLVDALVLLDGGYQPPSAFAEEGGPETLEEHVERARSELQTFATWDEFRAFLAGHFPNMSATTEAAFRAGMVERNGRIEDTMSAETIGAATHGFLAADPADTWPAIAASGVRVLLLAGGEGMDADRRAALDRFAAAVPAADLRVLKDAGHDPIAELGAALGRTIGDWLAGGWYDRLAASGVLDALAPYQPTVVGAHPLGIAAPDTPLEIVCRAVDLPAFARTAERLFGAWDGFELHGGSLDGESAVFAEFRLGELNVQVAAQAEHVHRRLGAATLGLDRALREAAPGVRARLTGSVARGEDWLDSAIDQLGLSRVAVESLATANPTLVRQVMGRPQPPIPLREYVLPIVVGILAMGLIVVSALARGSTQYIGIMFLFEAVVLGAIWGARLGTVAALAPLVLIGVDIGGSIAVGTEHCSPDCASQGAEALFVALLVASAAGVTGLIRDRYFPRT